MAEQDADPCVWDIGDVSPDTHVMPCPISDEFDVLGAKSIQAGLWRSLAIRNEGLWMREL
jgi:hypothetical protein